MKYSLVVPLVLCLGMTTPVAAMAQKDGTRDRSGNQTAAVAVPGGQTGMDSPASTSSTTASRKAREKQEGLSTDPDECVKHGVLGTITKCSHPAAAGELTWAS
jgi:hypothetical protein